MSHGKLRCIPSVSGQQGGTCTEYKLDFIALGAILLAASVSVWLMYSFLAQLTQVTQISDLLLSSDVLVFVIMLGVAIGVYVFAFLLGGWSLPKEGFFSSKDLLHTLFFGIVFATALGFATLPARFLATFPTPTDSRMVIALVLLAPVGEELLWRGAGYGVMNALMPTDTFPAFLLKAFPSSLMFSVGHFWAFASAGVLTMGNMLFTFLSGYILNFAYWYTKKLGVPIISHFIWNLIQLVTTGAI